MKKIIFAGLLLASSLSHAQLVQQNNTTGVGLFNGATVGSEYSGENTFVGYFAGNQTNPKVDFGKNTFVGYKAGQQNTRGMHNTFVGWNSGLQNTHGLRNVFLGSASGENNTTGYSNVFVGHGSGNSNINGNENIFLGTWAGEALESGFGNIFIGNVAGATNIAGFNNIFIGSQAGFNEKGVNNMFLGSGSGFNHQNGHANVFIGQQAGYDNINGLNNTFLGYMSGHKNVGYDNVFLGHQAGYNELGSSKLYISNSSTATPLIYGDFAANKLGIGGVNVFPTTAGNVNVSAYTLFVKGGILTEEVRVALRTGWADYVFAKDYRLAPLSEVAEFIKANKHLPNVPSAKEVAENGIDLGDMSRIQQEKIEELTLYIIEQDKQLKVYQKELSNLKEAVNSLLSQQKL